jgi:tRNA U34 5-methylaminomethyl-2-thiouridine-forming methyltransferase MnmC
MITSDGSTTIHIPDWDEQYHSKHGAIQESYHVFIKQGLESISKKNISILEIGFGTGLNGFITLLEAQKNNIVIDYVGVEAYPVPMEEVNQLNYVSELEVLNSKEVFEKLHTCSWEEKHQIVELFSLQKRKQFFHEIQDENQFDLIYFDAFGARLQPDLWTEEIFTAMFNALKEEGTLVTYSAKGSVRRAMQSVGFTVERLPGPPGKREMLRGRKEL